MRKNFNLARDIVLFAIFAFYLAIAVGVLFLNRTYVRSINLTPFATMIRYITTRELRHMAMINILGNVLLFVPLGVYLPIISRNKKIIVGTLLAFATSLVVEVMQYVLAVGRSDVDDLILNTLGGLVGVLCFRCLLLILKDINKVKNAVVIIGIAFVMLILIRFPIYRNMLKPPEDYIQPLNGTHLATRARTQS